MSEFSEFSEISEISESGQRRRRRRRKDEKRPLTVAKSTAGQRRRARSHSNADDHKTLCVARFALRRTHGVFSDARELRRMELQTFQENAKLHSKEKQLRAMGGPSTSALPSPNDTPTKDGKATLKGVGSPLRNINE